MAIVYVNNVHNYYITLLIITVHKPIVVIRENYLYNPTKVGNYYNLYKKLYLLKYCYIKYQLKNYT